MDEPHLIRKGKKRRVALAALAFITCLIILAFAVPAWRSAVYWRIGTIPFLDDDSRAAMLCKSAAAGHEHGTRRALETAVASPNEVFAMVFLEHLWDAQLPAAHIVMEAWLGDEKIAWTTDSRQVRRCDLATYYFRAYVGKPRWGTSRSLQSEVAERDAFRAEVIEYLRQRGLPGNTRT